MTDPDQIRCGTEDQEVRAFGATPHLWKPGLRKLLWWVESYPSGPTLTNAAAEQAFIKAMWYWSQVCPFTFERLNPATENSRYLAHILFKTAPLVGDIVATAQYPYEPEHVNQLTITFNTLKKFSVGISTNTVKLENATAHELGHNLGLTHSENPAALMYHQLVNHDRPQAEDIQRIRLLYPEPFTPPPPLDVPPPPPVRDEVNAVIVTPDNKTYSGKLQRMN